MKGKYICPKCHNQLRVGKYIGFGVKNKKKEKSLILLHPEIGNYSCKKNPEFKYDKCEKIEFFCPLCNKNLTSDIDANLIHVILAEGEKSYNVYFSRLAGEHSTYKVNGETVTMAGEHAEKYTCFKFDNKYKRYLKKAVK